MASELLKTPRLRTPETLNPSKTFTHSRSHLSFLPRSPRLHIRLCQNPLYMSKICSLAQQEQLSHSPPTTREAAIVQAQTSLAASLSKPLNNPRLAGKLKKLKQPRFRVEIPVVDDSPESLTQLAIDVFARFPAIRKGAESIKILIIWPNPSLTEVAIKATESNPLCNSVKNSDLSWVRQGADAQSILSAADVAVFFTPEESQLESLKSVSAAFYPKPVVVFNPKWSFEEEIDFGELGGFVGSFEVVYSFMGLEVRGILSRRKGVVFRNGGPGSSEAGWLILVEENGDQLKLITKFKRRPSVEEVENVLYNVMAVNSPVTKSVKFLRNLVSNVSGKKEMKNK